MVIDTKLDCANLGPHVARAREVASPSRHLPAIGTAPASSSLSDRLLALGWVGSSAPQDQPDEARALLLRASLLEDVARGELRSALEKAREMSRLRGELVDIAHHEEARVLFGLDRDREALGALRLAARASPAPRRSFHQFCLGTALLLTGDTAGAIASLERGRRWAHADRPLVCGALAWARLAAGRAQPRLSAVVADLAESASREGYGQLVLGMIAHHTGDRARAAAHLRAFLRRNARVDPNKALSLRAELREARRVLASIESL